MSEFTPPFTNGENAALQIGAANYSIGQCATGNAPCEPSGIVFDPSGNLWAADGANASIQEFRAPFSVGEASSVFLGGFYLAHAPNGTAFGPAGLAFDSSGDLWVADAGHNRELEFTPPFNRQAASLVIGQSDFSSSSNPDNQSMLNEPNQVTFDQSGNLWVTDTGDSRILEFRTPW